MARDGLFVDWVAVVHSRFRTPHRAIALQCLWAIALVWTGTYRVLFPRVVCTEWILFALMAAGLMRLRRLSTYVPVYRVWGYPIVPIVFIVASSYIVVNQFATEPVDSWTGLLLVAAGLPINAVLIRRRKLRHPRPPFADHAD